MPRWSGWRELDMVAACELELTCVSNASLSFTVGAEHYGLDPKAVRRVLGTVERCSNKEIALIISTFLSTGVWSCNTRQGL